MDKKHSIAIDVGEKFDAIFGEEKVVQEIAVETVEKEKEESKDNKTNSFGNISITQQLKSIILSIEWDMKDDFFKKYNEILSTLHDRFKDNIIALGLIRILQFLGMYIQVKKNEADSRVGKMILKISEKLEWVLDSDASEAEKKTVFADIVGQYRNWANTTKDFAEAGHAEIREIPLERGTLPLRETPSLPQDAMMTLIEEIKGAIREEFNRLISEGKIRQELN